MASAGGGCVSIHSMAVVRSLPHTSNASIPWSLEKPMSISYTTHTNPHIVLFFTTCWSDPGSTLYVGIAGATWRWDPLEADDWLFFAVIADVEVSSFLSSFLATICSPMTRSRKQDSTSLTTCDVSRSNILESHSCSRQGAKHYRNQWPTSIDCKTK